MPAMVFNPGSLSLTSSSSTEPLGRRKEGMREGKKERGVENDAERGGRREGGREEDTNAKENVTVSTEHHSHHA